jgi:SET domain-containing protein
MKKYYIKFTDKYQRGLYADRAIKQNEILAKCELIVLSKSDTEKLQDTELKWFKFCYDKKRDCLVLGDGELFNGSDEENDPNVGYFLEPLENRKVMVFYALRDLKDGEQLFIDYSADEKVQTNEYKEHRQEW